MEEKNNRQRIAELDLLKAIAIFLVVFYHSTTYKFNIAEVNILLYRMRYFCRTIIPVSVPTFFS